MKNVPVLVPVLALTFAAFIGIMIYTWVESEKAKPKMLDEHGNVKQSLLHPLRARPRSASTGLVA